MSEHYSFRGSHTSQEAEATKARLHAASSAIDNARAVLESKGQMMEWLDVGTTHIGLLIGMGNSAAEVCSVPSNSGVS